MATIAMSPPKMINAHIPLLRPGFLSGRRGIGGLPDPGGDALPASCPFPGLTLRRRLGEVHDGRMLPPPLFLPPPLRPRLHFVPAPHSAAGVLGERSGEAGLIRDPVGSLLADAEEFRDLDEP
jgi:hypothetical protein